MSNRASFSARLLGGVAALSLVGVSSAFAQSAEGPVSTATVIPVALQNTAAAPAAIATAAAPKSNSGLEEVVVTASRARSGFAAPTPTTVVSAQLIQARGATNVAEVLNEVPAFRATHTATATTRSSGFPGGTFLDLRGLNGNDSLGVARTLVLVDGRRFVPTTANMQVDINMIPTSLLDRTEVVTGGASAAWGSDAVAGVVNLILKDKLQGVQGNIGYEETDKSDYREYNFNIGAGTSFAQGRGHIIAGIDYVNNGGAGDPMRTRAWGQLNPGSLVLSPTRAAGLPAKITSNGVIVSNRMTAGGIIVGGPLAGTYFLPGGGVSTTPFVLGPIVAGNQMLQGANTTNAETTINGGSHLADALERHSSLLRGSYDITNNITGYVELSEGASRKNGLTGQRRDDGAITVQQDNAFLPASVKAAMIANNLKTITVGRIADDPGYGETGRGGGYYKRYTKLALVRGVAGLKGSFGDNWKWDAYVETGRSHYVSQGQATDQPNYNAAIDSIRDANGNIVCRPGTALNNAAPGCVPFNIFGQGSPSQAAINYVLTYGINNLTLTELAGQASINGNLFTLPAGPVSVAAGVEYRGNRVDSFVSTASGAGRLDTSSFQPIHGEVHDEEFFGEVDVPILKDKPLVRSLDTSVAVRETNYSTSGAVTTWKVGATYAPIDDIKFRATKSRDIRAPNLNELYQKGQGNFASIINPFTGLSGQILQTQVGSTKLIPEEADTITGGFVLQPRFIPGFRASVDYFNINIAKVIATLTPQQIVDQCYGAGGDKSLCGDIELSGQTVVRITVRELNFNKLQTDGVDIEANYRVPPDFLHIPGALSFDAQATNTRHLKTTSIVGVIDRAGQVQPFWAWNFNTYYNIGRWSFDAQVRYIDGILIDATFLDPTDRGYNPALPNSTNINHQPNPTYFNMSASYDVINKDGRQLQVYGIANNIFDVPPPPGSSNTNNNGSTFDVIGRVFRVGVRFKY